MLSWFNNFFFFLKKGSPISKCKNYVIKWQPVASLLTIIQSVSGSGWRCLSFYNEKVINVGITSIKLITCLIFWLTFITNSCINIVILLIISNILLLYSLCQCAFFHHVLICWRLLIHGVTTFILHYNLCFLMLFNLLSWVLTVTSSIHWHTDILWKCVSLFWLYTRPIKWRVDSATI